MGINPGGLSPYLFSIMEDKEIIYLALCNQVQSYQLLLEDSENLSEENRGMAEYIISRSLEMIDKLALELGVEGANAIKRPRWDNLPQP